MPLYGAQLLKLSTQNVDHLHVTWRKCIRKIFNVPPRTHSWLLHLLCLDYSFPIQLFKRCLKYVNSLQRSNNSCCTAFFQLAVNGSGSALNSNLLFLSDRLNVPLDSICDHNVYRLALKRLFMEIYDEAANVEAGLNRDLLSLRSNNGLFVNRWRVQEFNEFLVLNFRF